MKELELYVDSALLSLKMTASTDFTHQLQTLTLFPVVPKVTQISEVKILEDSVGYRGSGESPVLNGLFCKQISVDAGQKPQIGVNLHIIALEF